MKIVRTIAFTVLVLFVPTTRMAAAHELSVLAGTMQDTETGKPSYAWQLEFRNWMSDRFAVGLSYLNEGHVPYHHRDGGAAQAWTRMELFAPRLSLSGGIGPYYFFDSTQPPSGMGYANEHGWGIMGSLSLSWYAESRLVYQVRANVVETGSLDTQTVLFGVGYQWDEQPWLAGTAQPSIPSKTERKNELAVFAGRTIVNSFESEHSLATVVEYRRLLGRSFEGTIAMLDEGKNAMIDRSGAAAQLWLAREFFEDRVSIGFGGGGYYAEDRKRHPDRRGRDYLMSGIASFTVGIPVADHWKIRTTWSRVHTHYHRDTDLILAGLGCLF